MKTYYFVIYTFTVLKRENYNIMRELLPTRKLLNQGFLVA